MRVVVQLTELCCIQNDNWTVCKFKFTANIYIVMLSSPPKKKLNMDIIDMLPFSLCTAKSIKYIALQQIRSTVQANTYTQHRTPLRRHFDGLLNIEVTVFHCTRIVYSFTPFTGKHIVIVIGVPSLFVILHAYDLRWSDNGNTKTVA